MEVQEADNPCRARLSSRDQVGCQRSRLDHGLKVQLFPQERLPFLQNLAPLAAKYMENGRKNREQINEKVPFWVFNLHQRCGYSDSPFARIYFFYTAGSRNRLEGMEPVCTLTKKQKTISKRHVLLGKCFEDARQDEKHVPDLLDVIIQPLVL